MVNVSVLEINARLSATTEMTLETMRVSASRGLGIE